MKRLLKSLAWLYLGFLGLVLLVLTPLLNTLPAWWVERSYQRQLTTELVIFNPFSLALELRRGALGEPDGGQFASIDRVAVNLSLASLWQPGWTFDVLAAEGLELHLRRESDGRLNIADLLPANSTDNPPEAASDASLPPVRVERLRLSARRIRVSDDSRPTPFTTHWDNLGVTASDLSTVMEAGQPYHLRLEDEAGGFLDWRGQVSLAAASSQGHITLGGLALRPAWRYLKDQLAFEVASARLDLAANYELDWAQTPVFGISDGHVALHDMALLPAAHAQLDDTAIRSASISLSGINVDSEERRVNAGLLAIDGLDLQGGLENGEVSIVGMLRADFPQEESPPPADEESAAPWRLALAELDLRSARVRWRSPYTRPAELTMEPLSLQAQGIEWPATAASTLALQTRINRAATLEANGQLHLGSGNGQLQASIEGLPVPWFEPNLPAVLNANIGSGSLGTSARLELAGYAPRRLQLDGAIEDFAVQLAGADNSLTRWHSLTWQGLDVNLPARSVELARLSLDQYAGRIHILEDGSLNIQRLLREDAAQQAGQSASAPPAEDAGQAATTAPWSFRAPAIHITDSEVDFLDESLPLHFRTVIGEVNGDITGLNSAPGQALSVAVTGSVDGYAPVVLEGTAAPFREAPALDLHLTFTGVDLARLTPYSGTYAGYEIDRGTMNLDLRYSLAENRLQGDNALLIKQLKLGDPVASERALNLPLKLGIALLTDANGVIDLAVPVSGDVDDPRFSLGSVIAGAFVNLLTKAVTAPFKLLAGLVGSEEDLERVTFAAGSEELDATGRDKLEQLAGALRKRPALQLVVTGRLHPETDRRGLQARMLREQLLARGLSEQSIASRDADWGAAIAERYRALPATGDSDGDAAPPPAAVQAQRVRAAIAVSAERLLALGNARAAAAKRFLVNEAGIASDRAVLANSDLPEGEEQAFSGVDMDLDT